MAIFVALLPLLAKLGMYFLDTAVAKSANNKELKALLIKVGKALREAGIASVQSRFESESQIDQGNEAWDELLKK